MKVLHLISGGDTGGAKTHVHSLLAGLTPRIQVQMVWFTDGPFVEELKNPGLRFRGSSNQRLIDVPKSLAAGSVVIWDDGYGA